MKKQILAALIISLVTIAKPIQATFADAPTAAVGFAIGAAGLDANDFGDAAGLGLALNLRFNIPNSIIDIEGRISGAQYELDDIYIQSPNSYHRERIVLDDGTLTTSDIRLQFIANLARNAIINPYLVAGCVFKGLAVDYEVSYSYYSYYFDDYIEEDEYEATYCAGAGLEINAGMVYARGEVSYVGETFDNDGDISIYGNLALDVEQCARVGIFGSYNTEDKDWLALIGFEFYQL